MIRKYGSLTVEGNPGVPDGTQVWLIGNDVVDITNDDRAKFLAMFGLMAVPHERADRVLLSVSDYEHLKANPALTNPKADT